MNELIRLFDGDFSTEVSNMAKWVSILSYHERGCIVDSETLKY